MNHGQEKQMSNIKAAAVQLVKLPNLGAQELQDKPDKTAENQKPWFCFMRRLIIFLLSFKFLMKHCAINESKQQFTNFNFD